MKDLGLMHYFLGLEVWQRPGEIFLFQGKYIVKMLEIFPRPGALLPRPRGLEKSMRDFPFSMKIHCEAAREIWDGGL